MPTIHLIYPCGPKIACPDAIGRHLAGRLQNHYAGRFEIRLHDLAAPTAINPHPGDVLLGHAHPFANTCFRLSLQQPGWRRKILIGPYNHGDLVQVAFVDRFIRDVDLFLAITGRYWFDDIPHAPTAHWRPKMVHLDLAIDRSEFPRLKHSFNPPGQRRFVYIGHNGWQKNVAYLSQIARACSSPIAWMGAGKRDIPGVERLGPQDFSTPAAQANLARHDFMITVGKSDANPATILEAMGWGLIPVCTPQSGYTDEPGIVNVPLVKPRDAAAILDRLQQAPDAELVSLQAAAAGRLDTHYHWDRFAQQVITAIDSDDAPECARQSPANRLRMRAAEAAAPYQPWYPKTVVRKLKKAIRGR